MTRYHVAPCPCGHGTCKDWHVEPIAAVQGVKFSEGQARRVAALLNAEDNSLVVAKAALESYLRMRTRTGVLRKTANKLELESTVTWANIGRETAELALAELIDEGRVIEQGGYLVTKKVPDR